jgi:hypothetical protein
MKYKKYIPGAIAIIFVGLVAMGGCRKNAENAGRTETSSVAVQMYELSPSSNFVAQTREPVEVEADLFFPDRVEPVRTRLRITPGTWAVPEQVLVMPMNGSAGEVVSK